MQSGLRHKLLSLALAYGSLACIFEEILKLKVESSKLFRKLKNAKQWVISAPLPLFNNGALCADIHKVLANEQRIAFSITLLVGKVRSEAINCRIESTIFYSHFQFIARALTPTE